MLPEYVFGAEFHGKYVFWYEISLHNTYFERFLMRIRILGLVKPNVLWPRKEMDNQATMSGISGLTEQSIRSFDMLLGREIRVTL